MSKANGSVRPNQPVQRFEPLDELAPHIEVGDARGAELVLERAGHEEIDAELVNIDRTAAGALIVVDQAPRTALVTELHQRGDVDAIAVAKTDLRRRHNQRAIVDQRGVGINRSVSP